MSRENKDVNWIEIMENFSAHKGTIVGFSRENNITPQKLYRHRKKSKNFS